jgi:hypothetical protein
MRAHTERVEIYTALSLTEQRALRRRFAVALLTEHGFTAEEARRLLFVIWLDRNRPESTQ